MDDEFRARIAEMLIERPLCESEGCLAPSVSMLLIKTPNTETNDPDDTLISLESRCAGHVALEAELRVDA